MYLKVETKKHGGKEMNKKEKEDKRKEKEVIVRWKQNTAIKGNYLEKLKSTTTRKIRI